MKLRYTPEAREDLLDIHRFIASQYGNPDAARKLTKKIMKSCSGLKEFPRMGMRLSEKIQRETPLRYLICGNHFVFYRIDDTEISVIRILDGRTNYLQVLFAEE